jgi:hypothetical protein
MPVMVHCSKERLKDVILSVKREIGSGVGTLAGAVAEGIATVGRKLKEYSTPWRLTARIHELTSFSHGDCTISFFESAG